MLPVLCLTLTLVNDPALPRVDALSALQSRAPLAEVAYQAEPDGLWIRGDDYKARASAASFDFYPRLGPRAPRGLPLSFGAPALSVGGAALALDAVIEPQRYGHVLSYDRGPLVEQWTLRPGELEHAFVLPEPLGGGDLALRIPVATAQRYVERMPGRARGAGLQFDADGFARCTYSDAVVVDARGARIEAPVAWDGGAIAIDVPADFLATAAYPVTIDPLLATFAFEPTPAISVRPDVAYDDTTERFLVVYSINFDQTDVDIEGQRIAFDGTPLGPVFVDFSDSNDVRPSVANSNAANVFLIAYSTVTGSATNPHDVLARIYDPATHTLGPVLTLASSSQDEHDVAVGGSRESTSSFFAAWNEEGVLSDRLKGRKISASGELSNVVDLSPPLADLRTFSITKTNSEITARWAVAYTYDPLLSTDDGDTAITLIAPSGGAFEVDFHVATGSETTGRPSIAGDGDDFFVTTPFGAPQSSRDLALHRLRLEPGGLVKLGSENLSLLPGYGMNAALDQESADIDTDGCRYTIAYAEGAFPDGNYDVRVTTLIPAVASSATVPVEVAVPVPGGAQLDRFPVIAMSGGAAGELGRSFVAWESGSGSSTRVLGALYEWLEDAAVTKLPTGCGGVLEPALTVVGQPFLGEQLWFTLGGSGAPLLVLGHSIAPLPLCPAQASCALGVAPITASFPVASVNFAVPCDPALLGVVLAVQGVRMGGTSGGACTPPAFPFVVRTSDTAVVRL